MKVYLLYVGECEYSEHEGLLGVFATKEAAQIGADAYLAERLAFKQQWREKLRTGQAPVVDPPDPDISLRWSDGRLPSDRIWYARNPIEGRSNLRIEERDLK